MGFYPMISVCELSGLGISISGLDVKVQIDSSFFLFTVAAGTLTKAGVPFVLSSTKHLLSPRPVNLEMDFVIVLATHISSGTVDVVVLLKSELSNYFESLGSQGYSLIEVLADLKNPAGNSLVENMLGTIYTWV